MNKTYLLTGGTGFLGSLLSIELIKKGDKVIFLGRPKDDKSFEQRIKEKLQSIDPNISLNNIDTIEINLHKEDLGLSNDYINKFLGKIDAIWHLAANLSFKEKNKKEIFNTNINGLENILNFAGKIGVPVFYISTAYVYGQRPGVIFEDELIKPKHFNNYYEESKFEGEKLIRKWSGDKSNRFIIFRPSILIDPKVRTLSFFGYYAIVRYLYKLKKKFNQKELKVFVPYPYSEKCLLNLMPVDIAIKWMLEISSNQKSFSKTFHITNPKPFPMKDISKQTFDAFNIKIPLVKMPGWFIRLCFSALYYLSFLLKPIRGLAKGFYYYRYYMTEYNVYDMKNTKEIIGDNLADQFNFPDNYIENIAREFIKKLDEKVV